MPFIATEFCLAVDLGGTRIKLGLVREGEILASRSVEALSRQGLAPQLILIRDTLGEMCGESGLDPRAATGIGMGFPGLVNSHTGRILSTLDKYADARKLDLPAWARSTWGLPLALDNDANMALMGEWRHGAGRGHQSVAILTLGTGIGASAIMEGRPVRGQHGQAGCLGGHITVNLNGRKCLCGNRGCLEAEASSWALPLMAAEHPGFAASSLAKVTPVTYKDLFFQAAQGDRVAMELRDHSLRVWGAAAVTMIHAYDPTLMVLGGGILASAEVILPAVQDYVDRHAWMADEKVRVVKAERPDTAALLGAAEMVARLTNNRD